MMEHRADNYECVKKYPMMKGYLEHFKQVSINNEIPGLISFFFILGQVAVPYVRIPIWESNIDPRVNMFWIQGKGLTLTREVLFLSRVSIMKTPRFIYSLL